MLLPASAMGKGTSPGEHADPRPHCIRCRLAARILWIQILKKDTTLSTVRQNSWHEQAAPCQEGALMVCCLSISKTPCFNNPWTERGFCSLPRFSALNLALWDSLLMSSLPFSLMLSPFSFAAECVCLILTKITAHVAFRWGHQKQNGGKRI